jgi:hypothetical protein
MGVCRQGLGGPYVTAVRDSGTFTLRVDTVAFFVADTMIGVHGNVENGLLRNDSLTLWGSDLDGGDYLYLKSSP